MPNSLDSYQAPHCVGSDMDPNCLQRLSSDSTSICISDLGQNCLQRLQTDCTSMSDLDPN